MQTPSPEAQAMGNLVRSGLITVRHPDIPPELKQAAAKYILQFFRLSHVTYSSEDCGLSSLCAVCPSFDMVCDASVWEAACRLFTTINQELPNEQGILNVAMCRALGVHSEDFTLRI